MVRSTKRRWLVWWSQSTRCWALRALIGLPSTRRFVSSSETKTIWQHKDSDHQQLVTMLQPVRGHWLYHWIIFPKATAHAARLFKHVDVDGDGELNENEFLEVQKYHYLGLMFYSKFSSKSNHCLHQGCQKDSELMEKLEAIVSQCMINTATWLGPSCSFDLTIYNSHFTDMYIFNAIKKIKTTSQSLSPLWQCRDELAVPCWG